MLQTSPSFSIFNSTDESEPDEGVKRDGSLELERSVTIGENIAAMGSGEFSFVKTKMRLIEEEGEEEEALGGFEKLGVDEGGEPVSPRMYLATGLGIDGGGYDDHGGGGVDLNSLNFDGSCDVEEYYRKMVDEYPCHPLFLRNYAQLLQSKGELHGAETYYYRATLADPGDGEIMSKYAKLVWELHRDQDRASTYFKRAAQAASEDSYILAAYAGFLWEIDDEEEEENDSGQQDHQTEVEALNEFDESSCKEQNEPILVTAADSTKSGNTEESYMNMVEENSCNPLFLRNYAQFLYESKGDLQGAEEYYSRAILADPGDGEVMSKYAKLVWEQHHDREKASSYFEKSVQATPGDCHILAAYASFLWETEEDEDCSADEEHIVMPIRQGLLTSANA